MSVKAYIYEQPAALRAVFRTVPQQLKSLVTELVERPPARVLLVGSGSSRNALTGIRPLLDDALPCTVEVCGPTDFVRRLPDGEDRLLAILLSQSGTSRATVEAARHAQFSGMRTAVITAEPDSPLAALPGYRVLLPIGSELVGPKTKGYTASIAALMCLCRELHAARGIGRTHPHDFSAQLDSICEALGTALTAWEVVATDLARRHSAARYVMILGEGRHLATALEGSLKIAEMSGVPSAAFETEEGLHGRFHALSARDLVVFIAGDPEEASLARSSMCVLADLGISTLLIGSADGLGLSGHRGGDAPPAAHPNGGGRISGTLIQELPVRDYGANLLQGIDLITLLIPLQFFGYELGLQRGMDPDRMRYPGLSSRLGIKLA